VGEFSVKKNDVGECFCKGEGCGWAFSVKERRLWVSVSEKKKAAGDCFCKGECCPGGKHFYKGEGCMGAFGCYRIRLRRRNL